MSTPKQIALGLSMRYLGYHAAAWRHPAADPDAASQFRHYKYITQTAEAAKLDMVFLADGIGLRTKGKAWYENTFIPFISPFALYGLLFTIVLLFALQGDRITNQPLDVARIALPLLAYFAIMWFGTFWVGRRMHLSYERDATIAFTAAGNNFELAIAVAIAVFGVSSGQALAGVVGPLIEVPVLVGLVYVSRRLRPRFTTPV